VGYSPSPPAATLSPRSEVSPSPSNWTSAQEQLAQEEYENELAEQYIYDLTRRFARATRALALYDCQTCLEELEQLPHVHQNSPWVIAIVGRAHFERQDYASVRVIVLCLKVLIIINLNFITG
jgi:anaphase-promoting complex subunit 3